MPETILHLQIILTAPSPGVVFALQKGAGAAYETVQRQVSETHDLSFTFSVQVKGDRSKDEQPKLSGSFVQGPANGKFVYINIGTYAGQVGSAWARRLKVPLSGISWKDVDAMKSNAFLQAIVPGTGKDGGPNCATVKPFAGWHVKQS
jgi:hypothetical protein